jgi:hypothetical protein
MLERASKQVNELREPQVRPKPADLSMALLAARMIPLVPNRIFGKYYRSCFTNVLAAILAAWMRKRHALCSPNRDTRWHSRTLGIVLGVLLPTFAAKAMDSARSRSRCRDCGCQSRCPASVHSGGSRTIGAVAVYSRQRASLHPRSTSERLATGARRKVSDRQNRRSRLPRKENEQDWFAAGRFLLRRRGDLRDRAKSHVPKSLEGHGARRKTGDAVSIRWSVHCERRGWSLHGVQRVSDRFGLRKLLRK